MVPKRGGQEKMHPGYDYRDFLDPCSLISEYIDPEIRNRRRNLIEQDALRSSKYSDVDTFSLLIPQSAANRVHEALVAASNQHHE
jgi:hypothetical protein